MCYKVRLQCYIVGSIMSVFLVPTLQLAPILFFLLLWPVHADTQLIQIGTAHTSNMGTNHWYPEIVVVSETEKDTQYKKRYGFS